MNNTLSICTNLMDRSDFITFSQGQYFGLEELLTGQQSKLQLQSQSFVKLLVLARSDFITTLKDNPKDFESFCKMKDEIMMHQRDSNTKCKSCNCIGHDIQNCPVVHFVIDKERVIKSHQFYNQQERVPGLRNRARIRNQFNAIFDQWFLQEIAQMIKNQEDLPIIQFYNIQQIEHSEPPQTNKQTLQSKDSIIVNDKTSFQSLESSNQITLNPPKMIDNSTLHPQNKVIRKNYTRQSIRIRNQGIKLKFQRIIKKVIKMQHYSKVFTFSNVLEVNQKFNKNIQKIVENYFNNPQLKEYLNKSEYEDLYFLRMKCNLIQYSEVILARPFEVQKEYLIYNVENNLSQIIKRSDLYIEQLKNKQHKNDMYNGTLILTLSQDERKSMLQESLIKYLQYPNVYFKKYHDVDQPRQVNESKGQKKAKALFKAYKKRQIMRQNAFLLPSIKRESKKNTQQILHVSANVIVPEN